MSPLCSLSPAPDHVTKATEALHGELVGNVSREKNSQLELQVLW
jgi:hypothetical protein